MGNDKKQDKKQVDARIQSGQDRRISHDENNNNEKCQNRNCDTEILSEGNDKKYIDTCCEAKEKEASVLLSNWITDLTKTIGYIYENKPSELRSVDNFQQDIDQRICDPYLSILDHDIELASNAYNYDEVDKINGKCFVTLKNGDECLGYWMNGKRQGKGNITGTRLENLGIKRILGDYMDGALTGLGRIVMLDGSWREGWFQHGYLHGPVKGMNVMGKLAWVGWYEAGMPVGTCWERVEGDGWLVGKVHLNGKMYGDDIAFVYPNLSSALVGRFENGRLVSATACRLVDASLKDGIMQPVFRKDGDREYKSWVSSSQDIACPPHQRDVYESRMVEVKESRLAGGGEGLFARLDVGPGVIVAFYNGLRWKPGGKGLNEDTGYAIYLDMVRTREERLKSEHMDLPEKYHSSQNYSSTLGHKANHSFSPNCNFTTALHPCYGRVPALQTVAHVKAGEEFLVHYTMDMENAPDWYKLAWELFTFDEDMEEEENEEYPGLVEAWERVPEEEADGDGLALKETFDDDLTTEVTQIDELFTKDTEDEACNNEKGNEALVNRKVSLGDAPDGDGLSSNASLDDDLATNVTQTVEHATEDSEYQACNDENDTKVEDLNEAMAIASKDDGLATNVTQNNELATKNTEDENDTKVEDENEAMVIASKETLDDDLTTNVTQTNELATKNTQDENDTQVEEEAIKQVSWGGVLVSEDDLCSDFGLFSKRWPRLNPEILEINWNMYRDGVKRRRQLYKKLNILYDG